MGKRNIYSSSLDEVGTIWKTHTWSNAPSRFIVHKVKAEVSDGTSTQVAIRLAKKRNPDTVIDIDLEYELGASPLISKENEFIKSEDETTTSQRGRSGAPTVKVGNLYIAVKCEDADNTVVFSIDYEDLS